MAAPPADNDSDSEPAGPAAWAAPLERPGASWVATSEAGPARLAGPPLLIAVVFLGLAAALLATGSGGFTLPTRVALIVLCGAAAGGGAAYLWGVRRRLAREATRAAAVRDACRLRQWPAALAAAADLLSGPVASPAARLESLVLLSVVLTRYHKFDDADALAEALLERIDGPATPMLRGLQAYGRLRTGRLLDADTALRGLRRDLNALGSAAPDEARALLALTEMYRDVQTNHHDEALDLFDKERGRVRDAAGDRVADFHALAAVARHARGEAGVAGRLWREATLLVPEAELRRRFPEVRPVAEAYQAAELWAGPNRAAARKEAA